MLDAKNWFDEKSNGIKPTKHSLINLRNALSQSKWLTHSYSFKKIDNQTKVKQVMEYTVKFGLIGKLLDAIMIRKQSDNGIKKFLAGLKKYAETH